MEPRIQYAQTSDGVSIAFWTLGEGVPLVDMPFAPFSHVQLDWEDTANRSWLKRLAQSGMLVVRYDPRGSGLSERRVTELSFETQLLDLEAVIDRLELERLVLFGTLFSGPTAVAYAVREPARVSHLVLCNTMANVSEWLTSPQLQGFAALLDKDWDLFTETVAQFIYGWSGGQEARGFAAFMRQSTAPEIVRAAFWAGGGVDVTELLPQVRCPTLVAHRRQVPTLGEAPAQFLASRMPNARLTILEGAEGNPALGDAHSLLRAICEFLGLGGEIAPEATAVPSGALVTILFTDITDSTALTQRLGDAQAQELVRAHNAIVREALQAHGGSEIKHTGDGIMASFPSASSALECAITIQRAVEAEGVGAVREPPLQIHVGLNAGEPVAEDDDLFGTAVQLARRICDQAEGGEILVSNVVQELAAGKGFVFSDRGEAALRGFEDPVRLYEVRWREDA